MSTAVGAQPSVLDVSMLYDSATCGHLGQRVQCIDLVFALDGWDHLSDTAAPAAAFAGGWLYGLILGGTGPTWRPDETLAWPLWEYADALAYVGLLHGLRVLGAIAHRDLALAYHRDKRAPAGTVLNATTLYARGCTGGELVLRELDVAFTPRHLRLVVYDGSTLHGVAPFTLDEGGYRLSLTFWLGER